MATGPAETLLAELLERWEAGLERGEEPSAEDLCADCPELLGELRRRIDALHAMDSPLGTDRQPAGPAPAPPGAGFEAPARRSASCSARFDDLRFHAAGGLGEVFTARAGDLNRDVALKFIRPRRAGDPESRRRFLLEAEVTGRLEHPGIVPVYGLGTDADGQPCYAMRFIRGRTLDAAVAEYHAGVGVGAGPAGRALAFRGLLRRFASVCNTVAYAHSRGILHRDIKPRNIMLGKYDETLLVDWGLARPFEKEAGADPAEETLEPSSGSGEATAGVVGTPGYMSPEQAEGRPGLVGPASDVYGLGATLYVVLTGRPPFSGRHVGEVLDRVRRGDFPRPREANPAVPRPLEAVCLRAMAREPGDRYASALDLAAELERWLADEPVAAYREPWPRRLGRWARRHRTLVTGAAVLLLTLTVALAAGLALIGREQARTERQRARAEANFAKAREAVDAMLTEVGEWKLALVPQAEPIRRELLGKALAFYEDLLRQEDTGEMRRELALAHDRVGKLRHWLGEDSAAADAYRKAIALIRDAAAREPGRPEFEADLATAQARLGLSLERKGDLAAAIEAHRQAAEILERLVAAHPGRDAFRDLLIDAWSDLANALATVNLAQEAEQAYRRAMDLVRSRADETPNGIVRRARTYGNLAGFLFDRGDSKGAEAILRETLPELEDLAARFPNIGTILDNYVNGCINLGNLVQGLHPAEAEAIFRRGIEQAERLVADNPGFPRHKQQLAEGYFGLASSLANLGRLSEAETIMRQAATIAEALVEASPDVPDHRFELGRIEIQLGLMAAAAARFGDVGRHLNRARELLERVVREVPSSLDYRQRLATANSSLGILHEQERRPAEAEAAHRRAIELGEGLLADGSARPEVRRDLVRSLVNACKFLGPGQTGQIEANLRRAVEVADELADAPGAIPEDRYVAATASGNLAGVLAGRGELAEARPLAERAARAAREAAEAVPHNSLYRQSLRPLYTLQADILVRLGDHAAAAREAEAWREVAPASGDEAYDIACILSRCAPAAEADAGLPEADRARLALGYRDRAMDALRAAVRSGFGATVLDHLKADPDLEPLRSRDDYKALVAELESGASPP